MFSRLFANRRTKAARNNRRCLSERRLRCEPLEERQLLSVLTFANNTKQAIPDKGKLTSSIPVSESYYAADVNVTLDISHTRDNDLNVYVIAPDGTRVELFTDVGGTGDNFNGTTLDDNAATSITAGSAPFSGTYRPEGDLKTLERKSVSGTWKLEVNDDTKKETGTLNSWSLSFTEAIGTATGFLDTDPTMQGNVSTYWVGANDVAMAENGEAMAVWIEYAGPGDTGPFRTMAAQYDVTTSEWKSPVIISDPALTDNVSFGLAPNCQIAGDGRGNYLAVWQEPTAGEVSLGSGSIGANRYVAGSGVESGWQTPQTIETDVSPSSSWLPVVAMAYDPVAKVSNAVVAWSFVSDPSVHWVKGQYVFPVKDLKVNRLTNFGENTWSGASFAEDLSVDINNTSLTVALAANGDFLLTFQDSNSIASTGVPGNMYIRHYQWTGDTVREAGWTGPASVIESRPEDAIRPRLAMNQAGDAIVSWVQKTGTGGVPELWARRWTGSGWAGDAELLSDDPNNYVGSRPQVAISDNGEAAVLYVQLRGGTQYSDIFVRRCVGGKWQPIVGFDSEDLGVVNSAIEIAMDDSGNIMAVWQQSDGVFNNLWSAKFDHSALSGLGSWSPAAILENAPYDVRGYPKSDLAPDCLNFVVYGPLFAPNQGACTWKR
jgi:subtilisin-like proprotein convertase family protein